MSEHLRVSYIESTFYTLFKILKITHKTCRHYLKRNKPRLGDIKKLSWSHSASEGQSWDSNPRLCWFHPQVLAGFTLLAPSSQTCQTRREFSGDLAFVGLRDEPPGDFTWELIPCPLAVPHLSKQERVHLPFLLKKYTSRWGVCVCVCTLGTGPSASLILFLINSEKIHPQNTEHNSLPYRPSTAGVISKDRGTGVVETTVARGSHLLDSWVTPGASAVAEGNSFPPSVSTSPLVTSRVETCCSCITEDKVASASWTAVVISWVMMP